MANAHPFTYGKAGSEVIGSHNGSLAAPNKYSVDTEYAIDLLSQAEPGDYQGALGEVCGWYVLTWRDARDKSIYLLNWRGQLSFCKFEGCIYYSSDFLHLQTAMGNVATSLTKSGDVWSYDGHKFRRLPNFKGKERWQNEQRGRQTNGFMTHGNQTSERWPGSDSTNPHGFTGEIQKWDCGFWHGAIRKRATDGRPYWLKLGNQAMFNRLYPNAKLGDGKWPGVGFVMSEEQVEKMQKANEEEAKKRTVIIIDHTKTPPLLAGAVADATSENPIKNINHPDEDDADALVRIAEEINEFKQRYGTDRELDVKLGPDIAAEKELENFQEKCIDELKLRGYTTEQALFFARRAGLFEKEVVVSTR